MFQAAVLFSGRDWLLPAAGFVGVTLALLWWSYRRASVRGPWRWCCIGLKLLGLLALAACLLEPLWSGQRARPGANIFAILADNSQGMGIKDRGATRSRGEGMRDLLLNDKSKFGATLEENFQLRRYLFDSRVQSTRDFGELAFDGRASSIGAALRTLADRFKGQPLAGIMLLTDGNATDLPDGLPDLDGLPPIYPVVIGTDDAVKDIALQKIVVSQTAFEDAPVTIQAEVTAAGYAGETIVAQLFKTTTPSSTSSNGAAANAVTNKTPARSAAPRNVPASSPMVAEQKQKVPRDSKPLSFRFQVKPEQAGLSFYSLQVGLQGAPASASGETAGAAAAEATLANNTRIITVDRGRGPFRILYVCGRPNWEFKFLNRALAEDDQVELIGLIRIARREAKFDFRGRAGESSNPLFRGFGNQDKEEIERYDQPVLVRLYPNDASRLRDEDKLRAGFPKLPEDLYNYHAVILDDLEAAFFSPDQMALLQKFVSERGGGFLMLGGAESYHEGKFEHTPIGDMLPVYLDQGSDGRPPGELRLELTREGWLQPWARLRDNESAEKSRLADVAPFGVLNKIRGLKPGASPIANVTDRQGNSFPALAVQRFGNGRTAALMIGDVWHWGLKNEANHKDMDKAWRQLIRWLVTDVPGRIELQVQEQPADPNQSVRLQVRARDKKFQPLDNATISLQVRSQVTTNTVRLSAEPALTEAGLYEATYVPRETGGYAAEAVVTDSFGMEVGRAEAGWSSDPAAEEFRSLTPNRALLESIARKSGGRILSASALDAFARDLPNQKAPITENWTSPLWHQASVFLFALACFVTEWGLRRWKGMA